MMATSDVRNARFGRDLRRALAASATAAARRGEHGLDEDTEARLWAGIEARLEAVGDAAGDEDDGLGARAAMPPPRPGSWPIRRWRPMVAGSLAAAALATFMVVTREPPTTAVLPQVVGVKGVEAQAAPPLRLKSLRFAVVNADGTLSPGAAGMRVKAGSPLVFAVEAEGVDASESGLAVLDLRYTLRQSAAAPQALVTGYRLRSGREILTGEQGYLAFTPPEPGTYQFRITAKRPAGAEAEGGQDEASVAIEVEAR
jgi:hypothetical protein